MRPREKLCRVLENVEGTALVAFLTAGYPKPEHFLTVLKEVAAAADVIELGVPFTDPMADGVTIQRSSQLALQQGVTLKWIFDQLESYDFELDPPILLMSYMNPLLAFGLESLVSRMQDTGVSGLIVPDLPYEESDILSSKMDSQGLALVQMVTPATPKARLKKLCMASDGFVYAVTRTGITGGEGSLPADLAQYLQRVKSSAKLPVCAGFGVRDSKQVKLIGKYADGVIVGSALVEVLEQGKSAGQFLTALRQE
ncbi:MAG: tryptophan synthase subunit alpha [Gammaproteobacteria bacterium]